MKARSLDVLLVVTVFLMATFAFFVVRHTGARADDICITSSGTFSLSHLAAECVGGLAADGSVEPIYKRGISFGLFVVAAGFWLFTAITMVLTRPQADRA